jgi:NADH dehydrogenase FAD-containing subunit
MEKHLVLAGGGHAHMLTLARLNRFTEIGIRVTVVQPSTRHYYSGMGPGMLGGFYRPEQIRFETRKIVEAAGGDFVLDRVAAIDPERRAVRLSSGRRLTYDAISLNVGSEVPDGFTRSSVPDVFPVKPISGLVKARDRFVEAASHRPVEVAVVGGGASAVEICGSLLGLARRKSLHRPKIRLLARGKLLSGWRPGLVVRARRSLEKRGARIRENAAVREVEPGRVVLADGTRLKADISFLATGVRPPGLIADSGLPTGEDGGLLVNEFLQSPVYPDIFGGGDCIFFAPRRLDKVGVYAVRQNPVLFKNLFAALTGGRLQAFDPGGGYMLILNMGDGTGVLQKGGFVFSGRLAFRIKDWIDRRFIRRFRR